jgi:outer membrane protein OmpA-like peptidoglycan-associated protein
MRSSNRRYSVFGVLILMGMLALSGCATKKFVRTEVSGAEGRLNPKITEVDNRVKEAGERIDAVDRRATQGIQAADQKATQAGAAAQAADTKATNAQRSADTATQGVTQANTRITAVENRFNTIDTYTAGQPQSITFKVGSATLSNDAKQTLDGIAGQVSGLNSGFLVELQGFTDTTGSENVNNALSQRRAESVKRYLVTKNVPLHRISIIGLGEANPVADNKTRAGREQNRRVEVRVLRSAQGRTTSNQQ